MAQLLILADILSASLQAFMLLFQILEEISALDSFIFGFCSRDRLENQTIMYPFLPVSNYVP